jgi:hypothetical protein
MTRSLCLALVLLILAVASLPAAAFTFADGKSASCVVRGATIREYEAPASDPVIHDRIGKTIPENGSYAIVWNGTKLAALPHEVHDFIFFHECAHAKIPTSDELTANCGGLRDMRAAGRAGPAVEEQLEAFFSKLNPKYWEQTVSCANRVVEPTPSGLIKLPPAPPPASPAAGAPPAR